MNNYFVPTIVCVKVQQVHDTAPYHVSTHAQYAKYRMLEVNQSVIPNSTQHLGVFATIYKFTVKAHALDDLHHSIYLCYYLDMCGLAPIKLIMPYKIQ